MSYETKDGRLVDHDDGHPAEDERKRLDREYAIAAAKRIAAKYSPPTVLSRVLYALLRSPEPRTAGSLIEELKAPAASVYRALSNPAVEFVGYVVWSPTSKSKLYAHRVPVSFGELGDYYDPEEDEL